MISQAGNFTLLFQKYSKPYISLLLTSACVKQKKQWQQYVAHKIFYHQSCNGPLFCAKIMEENAEIQKKKKTHTLKVMS